MRETALVPYPHQRELTEAWIDLPHLRETGVPRWRNAHEEKSRQMGITWILAWLELWATTYHSLPGLVMHLNFSEVDDGGKGSTPDSFFGKMRYMHNRLPDAYQEPLDFVQGLVKHQYRPTAYVTGEGAGPDPGRGGKYARAIVDEAARIPFGESAHAALSSAIPRGRLYNSTPKGEGNVYFRLRNERPLGYQFLRHHWSAHPVFGAGKHIAGSLPGTCSLCAGLSAGMRWSADDPRAHRYEGKVTSAWYESAILDLTDEQVAQELDIDYTASLTARVYPMFSEEVHVVNGFHGLPETEPFDPSLNRYELSWDYGVDTTAVGVWQDSPGELRKIGELEVHDADPDKVSDRLIDVLGDLGIPLALLSKANREVMLAVGDPAGEARQQATGRKLVTEYRRLGWAIHSQKRSIEVTLTAVKRALNGRPKPIRINRATCPLTITHFKNNRWETDREGNRKAGGQIKNDRHNHMMRADAYYIAYKFPTPDLDEVVRDAARDSVAGKVHGSGKLSESVGEGMRF